MATLGAMFGYVAGHTRNAALRYKNEAAIAKTAADKLEAESREADHKSEGEMRGHERWAKATTLLQISIALSASALLARKKWLPLGVYGSTAVGVTGSPLMWQRTAHPCATQST